MPSRGEIHIIDTTNRDGVRTAELCLSPLQKTMINLQLNELGVAESELGVAATRYEFNYINGNCKLQELGELAPIRLRGWITAMRSEVAQVVKHTRLKHLYLSVPSYSPLIQARFGKDANLESVIGEVCHTIDAAKQRGIETICVGKTDSARATDAELLMLAKKARDAGADRYRYCDTWGYENPFTIRQRVQWLASELKIPIELHCHDDLGMAVANSIAGALGALDAGVDAYISTTVQGVGERSGNTDLIALLLALMKSKDLRDQPLLGDEIKLPKLWRLGRYTAHALHWPISPCAVGIGANATRGSSGIHVDGMVRETQAGEVYNIEELGRAEPDPVETGRWIMTGGYAGVRGFRNIYGKLEIEFKDEEEAHLILDLARMANMQNHLPLIGDELRFIARYPEIAREIMSQNW
jgi:isopropylmalate/homocitrate/citramalate synthase